jgi:histidinol-phosphate aminotransferase
VADLAHLHGVAAEQILLGIGSSDLLRLAASAFLGPGRTAVMADPTFEIIALHGAAFGATLRRVPLTPTYAHDLDNMDGGSLVYICNPNNPTATITPKAAMRAYLDRTPAATTIIVDEAYHHYATSSDYESVIPLIAAHPNLAVVRTFSKVYALAGLRCGYAIAQKPLIDKLQSQQQFNVSNTVALMAARAGLTDTRHVAAAQKQNSDTKAWLSADGSGVSEYRGLGQPASKVAGCRVRFEGQYCVPIHRHEARLPRGERLNIWDPTALCNPQRGRRQFGRCRIWID